MTYGTYLVPNRRNSGFVARIHIPTHLRPFFNNRREIRRSVGTPDKAIARRRALKFWLKCSVVFEEATLKLEKYIRKQSDKKAELESICAEFAWMLETANAGINILSNDPDLSDEEKKLRLLVLNAELNDIYEGMWKELRRAGDELKDSEAALELADRTDKEVRRKRLSLEVAADFGHQLHEHHLPQGSISSTDQPTTRIPFTDICDRLIESLKARIVRAEDKYSAVTFRDDRPRVDFWREYFGDRNGNTITKAEITEINRWLEYLPARFSKKGISATEAIEMAKRGGDGLPPSSAATFNHYARMLKGILELAYQLDATPTDLSSMVSFRNAKRAQETKRLPFDVTDMQLMFPGSAYGRHFGKRGTALSWESKFWLGLASAFTGARLEELCQLTTDDVVRDEATGILYLRVTEQGEYSDGQGQSVKNKNSIRPVPVHSTLVDIGFLDFLKERQALKGAPGVIVSLFASQRGADGKIGSALSKWFTNKSGKGYIERVGILSKGESREYGKWSKSFHSFRHSVIDNLRNDKYLPSGERITEQDIALVVGHTDESSREMHKEKLATPRYGLNNHAHLELRRDIIEQIRYPGVDFDAIRWIEFRSRYGDMLR